MQKFEELALKMYEDFHLQTFFDEIFKAKKSNNSFEYDPIKLSHAKRHLVIKTSKG